MRVCCVRAAMQHCWGRPSGCRKGTTAIEMAIVAPAVLMLLLGLIDLGFAVYAYNTLSEAVRSGTRYAIVHGATSPTPAGPNANDTNVRDVVRSSAPGIMQKDLSVTATWPDGNNAPGSRVNVSAAYEYPLGSTWFLGFRTLRLTSVSSMYIQH